MKTRKNKKSENYLDMIPSIKGGLDWDIEDGIVVVHQQNRGFYAGIAQRFFQTPSTSHIRLDEFGSFVWQCIDGKNTVYDIGKTVRSHFGDRAEPVYQRLSQFIKTLENARYVDVAAPGKNQ